MNKFLKYLCVITVAVLIVLSVAFWGIRSMVGGVVVVEEALPGDGDYYEEELPVEFTVATYNIQGRPVIDDTQGKFPEIGRRSNRFDIVGFQECFVNYDYLWRTLNHPVKVFDGTFRGITKPVGSGLSTVGSFPLNEVVQMHFSSKGELQNRPASKGILLVRFDIGGHNVDVYNTHMEAGSSEDAQEARWLQVEELVGFVADNSPPEHSVIFLGDFNMSPLRDYHDDDTVTSRQLGFQAMMDGLGEGFYDASDEVQGVPDPETVGEGDPAWFRSGVENVDRVLYRAGQGASLIPLQWERLREEFRDDEGNYLSDHDPISVRFLLESL